MNALLCVLEYEFIWWLGEAACMSRPRKKCSVGGPRSQRHAGLTQEGNFMPHDIQNVHSGKNLSSVKMVTTCKHVGDNNRPTLD